MKKTILAVSAVLIMTACAKDHKCTCTSSNTSPGNVPVTKEITIVEVTKGQAKSQCVTTAWTSTTGVTYNNDCKLD